MKATEMRRMALLKQAMIARRRGFNATAAELEKRACSAGNRHGTAQ